MNKEKKLYLEVAILVVLIVVGILSLSGSFGSKTTLPAPTGLTASVADSVDSGAELPPPTDLEVTVE